MIMNLTGSLSFHITKCLNKVLSFCFKELLSIAKLHEVKYAIPEGGFHEHVRISL